VGRELRKIATVDSSVQPHWGPLEDGAEHTAQSHPDPRSTEAGCLSTRSLICLWSRAAMVKVSASQ
jgi:hypothetical protein